MTVSSFGDLAKSSDAATLSSPQEAPRHVLGELIWSRSRKARLLRRATLSLAFLFGLATLKVPIVSLMEPHVYRKDFLQEYLLARAIVEGVDPYLPITVLADRFLGPLPVPIMPHPTPHPPTAGLLFLPLAFLDYPSAAIAWVIIEAACLVASVHLLVRIAGVRLGVLASLIATVSALAWYPFLLDLVLGQLMLPLLLLLTSAWCALIASRYILGGIILGLSLLLKPVAWPLLLVFVVRRDLRVLVASLSMVLLGYGIAAWTVGVGTVFAYLTQVLPAVTRLYQATSWNISAWTVGWRVFDGTRSEILAGLSAPPLIQSAQTAVVVSAALPTLVLLASLIIVQRQSNLARSLGLMICVSILVSPISWNHYLLLATVPAVDVGRWLIRHHMPPRETNVALLVAVLLLPKGEWGQLALAVAGETAAHDGTALIPFAPALLTLMPAVAVTTLAILQVVLPELTSRTVNHRPCSTLGDS